MLTEPSNWKYQQIEYWKEVMGNSEVLYLSSITESCSVDQKNTQVSH